MSHSSSRAARHTEDSHETSPLLQQLEGDNALSNACDFSTPSDVNAKVAIDYTYMAGAKLWLLVTAITTGTSLVLLDMSIIATVRPKVRTDALRITSNRF